MLYVRLGCLQYLVLGGVPTSFYSLSAMFSTNRGTPQYYSPFNQIKAVAHIILMSCSYHIHGVLEIQWNPNGLRLVAHVGKVGGRCVDSDRQSRTASNGSIDKTSHSLETLFEVSFTSETL